MPVLIILSAFLIYAFKPITFEKGDALLQEYEASLDNSCQTSNECVIANVGNCCGYYPACLNENAKPNPDYVRRICDQASIGGVCGFPSIESCECVNSKCEIVPLDLIKKSNENDK